MKIHVRRRHIRGALPMMRSCPIALAFEAATGERPRVEPEILYTHDDYFLLPRSAKRFIRRFDAGKPVKPFAFMLKVAAKQ